MRFSSHSQLRLKKTPERNMFDNMRQFNKIKKTRISILQQTSSWSQRLLWKYSLNWWDERWRALESQNVVLPEDSDPMNTYEHKVTSEITYKKNIMNAVVA